MKLKIVSDGTPQGTKVVNAETGEVLEDVSVVEWDCRTGRRARATIRLHKVPVDVEAEGEVDPKDFLWQPDPPIPSPGSPDRVGWIK